MHARTDPTRPTLRKSSMDPFDTPAPPIDPPELWCDDWLAFVAGMSAPETAESVQASAIAENQSPQLPYR